MTRLGVILLAMMATNKNKESTSLRTQETSTVVAGEVQNISQEEAMRIMDTTRGYAIVDVRTPEEYAQGHIKGAINIPLETLADIPPRELANTEQVILVYCHSGNRSRKAGMRLTEMGYTQVYCFGGINTWTGSIVR